MSRPILGNRCDIPVPSLNGHYAVRRVSTARISELWPGRFQSRAGESVTAIGSGHNLPQSGMARLAIEFFGLHQGNPGGSSAN